jgi:hypothetical protein
METQITANVNVKQNATYYIDREPFEAAIRYAMKELGSSKTLRKLAFEDDDDNDNTHAEYEEVAIIGMGLIFHLNGQEEPCLTDQEIHYFGKHPELLEDYLLQDASALHGPAIRTDPFWLIIVNEVIKAYVSAYDKMFFEVEV